MINLFDFTYCGDYNRQIQNLARMVPEKWSFSDTDDNGILKGYLEHTFKRLYEEQKVWEKRIMPYLIQDSLITIISRFMRILFPIWSRTGSPGFWMAFIQNTIC
jgi:hypothetical protein